MPRERDIRILFIEDLPADAVMVNHELRKGGMAFRSKRVETKEAFLRELAEEPPDIILSDHGLPSFDGFTALAIARDKCPEVPFIFVTSSLGEQTAIDAFAGGATDYVLKNNLTRLVPAMQRALRESAERTKLRQKESQLRESEERFRLLVESVKDYAIVMLDPQGLVTSWNPGARWIHGFSAEEAIGHNFSLFYTDEDARQGTPARELKTAEREGRFESEGWRVRKSGEPFWASVIITSIRGEKGKLHGFAQVTRDFTERKKSEAMLHKSEERYRQLVELCPDALFVQSEDRLIFVNSAAARLLCAESREQLVGKPLKAIVHPDSWKAVQKRMRSLSDEETTAFWKAASGAVQPLPGPTTVVPFIKQKLVRLDGKVLDVEVAAAPLTFLDLPAVQFIARDITERERVLERARSSEVRRAAILEAAIDAIISIDHEGKVHEWNSAAERMFGFTRAEAIGKELADLIIPPALRERHREGLARYLVTGESHLLGRRVELTACRRDGTEFPVDVAIVRVPGSEPPMFTGFVSDLTEQAQALAALRKSEALKSAILDTALDAIVSIDHEGMVQEWNLAAERILGYRREQALGRSLDDLIIPPPMREVYHSGLTHYLLTGVGSLLGRPIELVLRRADGTEFLADLAISRVPTEDPPRCTALIRDITDRKKAEAALRESEERLRHLIEGVKDYAIYLLDPEGRVATWNAGAERIKGYKADEIIGKPFSTFFTPEDLQRAVPDDILKRAKEKGRALYEGWRVRKDGSTVWVLGTITALRDDAGRLRGFSKVAQDMTERRKAEEEIRRLNEQLEQRVRERTAQLEAANEELEAFSYSVSHDLRTPLRHIAGYVEILQSEAAAKLDESGRQHLQTVADSAKNLGHLIDALLAFSRMGRSEMHEQRVSLATLVEEARNELRHDFKDRDIDWNIGKLPELQGDPIMLRQVFVNLISNAIKYTRKRPRAKIEIGAKETAHEVVCFVRDNGVGFDQQYRDKLFGVFQRLHPVSEFEGTGIGLANVRRIIHRHGGRTWAEGEVGSGATFYFSIPKPVKETA